MSFDVVSSVSVHPTEELLEEYSFGRVFQSALVSLEEHLLVCEECQARLLAIDEYKTLMKAGMTAFGAEGQGDAAPSPRFVLPRIPGTQMALAATFIVMLAGAAIVWRVQPPSAAASSTVKLVALRGGAEDGIASAPLGRPLDLVIHRTSVAPAIAYRIQVLSSSGREAWSGPAQITGQNISVHLPTPLSKGLYWVRLYSAGEEAHQLQREFGMRIE